jgi:hypothetical protein
MTDKLLPARISSLSDKLATRRDPQSAALAIAEFLVPYIAMTADSYEVGDRPEFRLLKMMAEITPDFIHDMAQADMRAICILVSERVFRPGELEDILAGRRAERELKC